jgi:hypothetical protein
VLQKPQQIFRPKVSIIQTENPKEQRDKERAERRESRERRERKNFGRNERRERNFRYKMLLVTGGVRKKIMLF